MNATLSPALDTWRINCEVTRLLVQNIPLEIWDKGLPASPRRTIRGVAAHLHNARHLWMRNLAVGTKLRIPALVDRHRVSRGKLVTALLSSDRAILRMLEEGLKNGGEFPGVPAAFIWGAWPRNVQLFSAYAVSHEAHHRGQLLVMARELGHRVPADAVNRLWQWSSHLKRSRET